MKFNTSNNITFVMFLVMSLFAGMDNAGAQSIADNEYKLKNYFWYSTNNAAALSMTAIDIDGRLELSYNFENGEFHSPQTPEGVNDISLHTDGLAKVGGFVVWGDFKFQNRFEKGSMYNVLNYEIEEDIPFFVADTFACAWNKQAYLMSFKIASPVLWDRVGFGLKLDYDAKVGAKQKDPRGETYDRYVRIYPSIGINLGNQILGVYATYINELERTKPTNENYRKTQMVFISNGLGNGLVGKVGGNDGLQIFLLNANTYGGGLQYELVNPALDFYGELSFLQTSKKSVQNPELPKPMGRIVRNQINADFKAAFGENRNHLAHLGGEVKLTQGIEYLLKLNTTAFQQSWDVLGENNMSNFNKIYANAGYDYQVVKSGRFDWSAGVDGDFTMRDYSYLAPANSFSSTNVDLGIHGAKQFVKNANSVLLSLDAGYGLSLGSDFIYLGQAKTAALAELYRKEAALLSDDNIKGGVRVAYGYQGRALHYNLDLKASYVRALSLSVDKIVASLTASITF